jgi:Domain of unknown function (DUF4760)
MQVVIATLLAVYFAFSLNHIASEPFFSRLGTFSPTLYDLFVPLFVALFVAYTVYRSKYHREERLSRKNIFWIVNVLGAITYVSVMSHLYDDQNKTPAIAITVGYLATIGWVYTNYMNLRSQQRAHTMNVLLSLRTNAVLNEHRINFFREYPYGKKMRAEDLPRLRAERIDPKSYNITSSNRATAILDSVQYMANLYEFICVGMKQGDLDETIIKMSLRGILVGYYDLVKPFIDDARFDDKGVSHPKVYENFLYYVERFREPHD